MAQSVAFETVEIGDSVSPFVRTTALPAWNRFAAVNDEFIPMHMEDDAGRAAGNEPGAFGMGNLRRSYLLSMLRAWAGDDSEVLHLRLRYRRINQKNDTLSCVGEVVGKEVVDGIAIVHLRIDVLDQNGQSTTPGEATVALAGSV